MSSWYVWSALGLYPEIPGSADLVVGSPLFEQAVVHRSGGDVVIDAPGASADTPYVHALQVDGKPYARPWLPAAFATRGGQLRFSLQATPDKTWGSNLRDAPPSFSPAAGHAGS